MTKLGQGVRSKGPLPYRGFDKNQLIASMIHNVDADRARTKKNAKVNAIVNVHSRFITVLQSGI